ncbi:MAG: PTS sugar transporter subunit IIA [Anaerolineae bacterium]|nr:PTS sugar transporter subunit IIA [Anaerolineae bacterium]
MNTIIIAHGSIAASAVQSLEMIVGKTNNFIAIDLLPDDTPEQLHQKVKEYLSLLDEEPVLFMVDFIGGTPFQVCAQYLSRPNTRCISGFNLPMLIHAAMSQNIDDIDDLVANVLQAGMSNIKVFAPD